jgi:mannose-6-phosphate isomerase
VKEETLLLLGGRLLIELESQNGTMDVREAAQGQVFHIPPGCRHRMSALETSDVLEVSTPELDDLVRLQDDFGRR